jgi:hypothetical protein
MIEVTRKQLAIVQACIVAIRAVLETASSDPVQVLALATRVDALLRRQDRLQRVIESAQVQKRAAKTLVTRNSDLEAELVRRGLL